VSNISKPPGRFPSTHSPPDRNPHISSSKRADTPPDTEADRPPNTEADTSSDTAADTPPDTKTDTPPDIEADTPPPNNVADTRRDIVSGPPTGMDPSVTLIPPQHQPYEVSCPDLSLDQPYEGVLRASPSALY